MTAAGKSRSSKTTPAPQSKSNENQSSMSETHPPSDNLNNDDDPSESGKLEKQLLEKDPQSVTTDTIHLSQQENTPPSTFAGKSQAGIANPIDLTISALNKKSPTKSSRTAAKTLTKDQPPPTLNNYVSALSGLPLGVLPALTSNTTVTNPTSNTSSVINLNDPKAVWSMAMSMARNGKESEADMYFKIHARLESARTESTGNNTSHVSSKRTIEEVNTLAPNTSSFTDALPNVDQLPPGAVIEGGILFIPGAKTSHTDVGLPAFFQKNIRELSGLCPLTIFDKRWQSMADSYHHDKKFMNEESGAVVQSWRGYPYPHEMMQSYAQWSVNFDNFVYALRHVYNHQQMAKHAEAHRANVAYIHSRDNWMTAFRYDIAVRLNFFHHRVTIGAYTSAVDISERREDIATNCFGDARRCDEQGFTDNPYAEGQPRFGYDWTTGLPKAKSSHNNNNNNGYNDNNNSNNRGNRNNRHNHNNYHHNNGNSFCQPNIHNHHHHNSGNTSGSSNFHSSHTSGGRGGGGRNPYHGQNFDPEFTAKKAAVAGTNQSNTTT